MRPLLPGAVAWAGGVEVVTAAPATSNAVRTTFKRQAFISILPFINSLRFRVTWLPPLRWLRLIATVHQTGPARQATGRCRSSAAIVADSPGRGESFVL